MWGWCYEEEGAPPYWPWVQPIRSYVNESEPEQLRAEMGSGAYDISGIVPEVRAKLPDLKPAPALAPEQARFRLFDSVAGFLHRMSEAQPFVLVMDSTDHHPRFAEVTLGVSWYMGQRHEHL